MTGEGGCVFNSLLRERIHGKIPQLVPPPSQLVLATTEALRLAPSLQVVLETILQVVLALTQVVLALTQVVLALKQALRSTSTIITSSTSIISSPNNASKGTTKYYHLQHYNINIVLLILSLAQAEKELTLSIAFNSILMIAPIICIDIGDVFV